jgi:predicted porin
MQKKLMAVAVAGALAMPVIAAAQSSVTISGRATYEYGIGDQGDGRKNVDYADTPGGSALRFAGQEALGGGMTAWFQCETSMDIRGMDQIGLCSRNSAVGFRGGFGNIFFGRWDTPFKRVMNLGTVGAEETGLLGTSFLGFGGSGGAATSTGNNNELLGETQQRQRFKRRETCMTTYDSPNFGGFQVMGAFTCGNNPADATQPDPLTTVSGLTNANANQKPRTISIGGQYVNGPLSIGIGYEEHKDMGGFTAGNIDLDDKGYGFGISYGFFNGNVLVGANWLRREWETVSPTWTGTRDTKKDTYGIGVDWRLAGPHQIQFQYQKARDTSGNGASIGGNGGAVGCGVLVGGTPAQGGTIGCNETGADQFSIAYQYHFSKRTTIKFGYVYLDNDARSNSVRIGNTAAQLNTAQGGKLGNNQDSYAFLIKHNF